MNVSLSQIDHMLFTSQPPSLHVVLHPTGPLNWTAVSPTGNEGAGSGRGARVLGRETVSSVCRMPFGDTAGCQPALRGGARASDLGQPGSGRVKPGPGKSQAQSDQVRPNPNTE